MGLLDTIKRGALAGMTGGLSEFTQKDSFGIPGAGQYLPIAAGAGIGALAGNPMAGLGLGAGVFSSLQQAQAAKDANSANAAMAAAQMNFSAEQAQKQMDFQERMSNTSVQRMMKDMQAAGINPMLAAGSGESTPSGAAGSSAGYAANIVPAVGASFMSSAKEVLTTLQGLQESNSRIDKNRASAGLDVTTQRKLGADAFIADLKRKFLERFVNMTAKSVNKNRDWSPTMRDVGMAGYRMLDIVP